MRAREQGGLRLSISLSRIWGARPPLQMACMHAISLRAGGFRCAGCIVMLHCCKIIFNTDFSYTPFYHQNGFCIHYTFHKISLHTTLACGYWLASFQYLACSCQGCFPTADAWLSASPTNTKSSSQLRLPNFLTNCRVR